jgi:hypothetical protein
MAPILSSFHRGPVHPAANVIRRSCRRFTRGDVHFDQIDSRATIVPMDRPANALKKGSWFLSWAVVVSLLAGCADTKAVADRGARELDAHRADPFRTVKPSGLVPGVEKAVAAHVEKIGVLGAGIGEVKTDVPTEFTRSFACVGACVLPDALNEVDRVVVGAGATKVSTHCSLQSRRRTTTYSATFAGDALRIVVSGRASSGSDTGVGDPITVAVFVAEAGPEADSGLSDCLTRMIPGEWTVPLPGGQRTAQQVCDILGPAATRLHLAVTSRQDLCVLTGADARQTVHVAAVNGTLVQTVDDLVPGQDPNAYVLWHANGSATVMNAPGGPLAVSSARPSAALVRSLAAGLSGADPQA